MAAEFFIQASDPVFSKAHDPEDESLSDAIQTISLLDTERALLVWHGIWIPLSYKYDLSLMLEDTVGLCEAVLAAPAGQRHIAWPSDTFSAVWDVTWTESEVNVHSSWTRVVGGGEPGLGARPRISVPREAFLAEWRRPLKIVKGAIMANGYTVKQIPGLARLVNVVERLPGHAHLYGNSSFALEIAK